MVIARALPDSCETPKTTKNDVDIKMANFMPPLGGSTGRQTRPASDKGAAARINKVSHLSNNIVVGRFRGLNAIGEGPRCHHRMRNEVLSQKSPTDH
eukprot:10420100-Heterocapsa_arctica.AAC.1